MKFVFVALFLSLAFSLQLDQFSEWKIKHNKSYTAEEEVRVRAVFLDNVKKVAALNKKFHPKTTFAVNKFADLTAAEFKKYYLSQQEMKPDPSWPTAPLFSAEELKAAPVSVDWRTKGAVTHVKNQGQCGSCWSFSTTGNVEGQWFLAGHKLTALSEQNLVDCDHQCMTYENQQACDAGCNGGLMPNAFTYIMKNKGIDTEASYPYEGFDSTCRYKTSNIGATVRNWTMISHDETQMAAWCAKNGPIAIAADAQEWQFYYGGVFYLEWCGTQLDHGILIVGYGTETDIFDQTMPYWIVKNSWGADWGESGYIRIERGVGLCGLNLFPCSSIV